MKKQTSEPVEDFSAALKLAREHFNQAFDERLKTKDHYETYYRMSEALLVLLQLKTGYRVSDLLTRATRSAVQDLKVYENGKNRLVPHLVLLEQKTEKRKKPSRKVVLDDDTVKKIKQHGEFLADAFPEVVKLLSSGALVDSLGADTLDELPLFYNPKTSKPLTRQWADNRLRGGERRSTELGDALRGMTIGRRISTHSLRKTYAHKLYQHTGCNINYVSDALGHANVTTTKHYLNIADATNVDIHLNALE
jgi:integrase